MKMIYLAVKETHGDYQQCPMRIAQHPAGYWYCIDCGIAILTKSLDISPDEHIQSLIDKGELKLKISAEQHNPKHQYDCQNCKFSWNCGILCACVLRNLPPAPPPIAAMVETAQEEWREENGL